MQERNLDILEICPTTNEVCIYRTMVLEEILAAQSAIENLKKSPRRQYKNRETSFGRQMKHQYTITRANRLLETRQECPPESCAIGTRAIKLALHRDLSLDIIGRSK